MDETSRNNLDNFIKTQISIFKEYNNYVDKEKWLILFDNIFSLIDYDLSNAVFNFQGLENVIHDIKQAKKAIILFPNYSRISGIAYENGYVRENSSKTDTLQSFPPNKGALLPWGSDNF